jgi:transcriptional antiterminator NusG
VANLLQLKVTTSKLPILSIFVSDTVKGYIFVESTGPHFVDEAVSGIKHARQRVPGLIKLSELERYIHTKPIIEELDINDTVEVVAGPLKGMKAKITKVDKSKNEVTLELLEATVTLPITVYADYVRLTEKEKKGG